MTNAALATPKTLVGPFATSLPLQVFFVLAGSLLLAASSWVEVPMWPVPMTAQTYAVLVIGAAYGSRLAAFTVAAYLLEGAAGLPVFSGGGAGFHHLLGPTGGYLIGFLIAATAIGWLVERGAGRSILGLLAAMLLGHALIFVTGVGFLANFVGPEQAIATGFTPFILGTILKTIAAAVTIKAGETVLGAR